MSMRSKEMGIENRQRDRPSRRFGRMHRTGPIRLARSLSLRHVLAALVGVGLLWRAVRYAVNMPIWGDEAFVAVHFFGRGFAGLMQAMEYHQVAPVGFLWLERLVSLGLGTSERALRLVPFLAGLGSLLLFARFCTRWLPRREALLAVGILAAAFYPVRHSVEIKPYSTDLFLAMAMLSVGWKIHESDRPRARDWAGLTAIGAVGVWCSYPLIFVSAAAGLCLAWRFRGSLRTLIPLGIFGAVVIASWLIFFKGVSPPPTKAEGEFDPFGPTWAWAFPPVREPLKLLWWIVDIHAGNMLAYPVGGKNFASSGTLLLVLVGGRVLWKSGRGDLLAYLLAPLGPLFVAAALEKYPYGTSARISLFMAPAFCLLAGVGLSGLLLNLRGRVSPMLAHRWMGITLAGLALSALAYDVAVPYKVRDDFENRRAIRAIATETSPADLWVAYDGLRELPRTKNLMLEVWLQQQAEVRYDILNESPVPLSWMPADASAIPNPAPGGRVWLIVHRCGYPGFSEEEVSGWVADLTRRFGEPERRSFRPSDEQTIDALRFPASRR